jgi:hypothetical protein
MPGLATAPTTPAAQGRYSTRNRGLGVRQDLRQAAGEMGAINSIARPRVSMFQPGYSIAEGDRAANERRGATLLQHQVEQQNRAQAMAEQAQTFGQDQQAQQNARAWASHALGLRQGEQGLQLAGRADTRAQGAYEQNLAQGTAAEIRRAYSFSRQQQIDAETDPLRKKALQLELARQEAELDAMPEEKRQKELQRFINGEVLQDRWDSLPADKQERDEIRTYNGEMRKVGLDAAKNAVEAGKAATAAGAGGGLSQYKGKAGNMGVAMARKAGFEIPDDKTATAEFDEMIGWLRQHNPQATPADLAQQAAKELGYPTLDDEIAKQQKIIGPKGLLAGNGLVWDSDEVNQAQAKLAELQKRKAAMGGGLQGQPAAAPAQASPLRAAGAAAGAAFAGAPEAPAGLATPAPAASGAAPVKAAAMPPQVTQAYQMALAEGTAQEKSKVLATIQKAVEAGQMSKSEAFALLPPEYQQRADAEFKSGWMNSPLRKTAKNPAVVSDRARLMGLPEAGYQFLMKQEQDQIDAGYRWEIAGRLISNELGRAPMSPAPDNPEQAKLRESLKKQAAGRQGAKP